MGYLIGAGPLDPAVKRYDGGTSSFTMDNSGTTNGTLLWVDGVAQVPGTDYNVSGTTITTTTAAGAGTNNVTSLQLFQAGVVDVTADNSVSTAKIVADAVTLAKMAAGTDGNIISYDTSGNPVAVATGNDGQVLTSSGTGAVCAFEDAGGGAWNIIGTAVASDSASLTVTGLDSTYDTYAIAISDIKFASDSVMMNVRFGDSSGIDSGASDYGWGNLVLPIDATSSTSAGEILGEDVSDAQISLVHSNNPLGNATAEGFSGMYWLNRPADGSMWPSIHGTYHGAAPNARGQGGFSLGLRHSVITLDRIQILASSGNLTTGRLTVWGVAHA